MKAIHNHVFRLEMQINVVSDQDKELNESNSQRTNGVDVGFIVVSDQDKELNESNSQREGLALARMDRCVRPR